MPSTKSALFARARDSGEEGIGADEGSGCTRHVRLPVRPDVRAWRPEHGHGGRHQELESLMEEQPRGGAPPPGRERARWERERLRAVRDVRSEAPLAPSGALATRRPSRPRVGRGGESRASAKAAREETARARPPRPRCWPSIVRVGPCSFFLYATAPGPGATTPAWSSDAHG